MADNIAGSAAWFGGVEIVNDTRTTAYMRNGIKPDTLTVQGDCGCADILTLAGCDSEYTTPAQDGAPWYDVNIPESAEFAGFLTTEFEGMGSTFTRSVVESIGDGGSLGRSRYGTRELTWTGYLFGSSCCGVAYGLRWLNSVLRGSNKCGNSCSGEDLEILVCCPTLEAAQGLGPNLICNGDFDTHVGFWTATGDTALTWNNAIVYSEGGSMKTINPIGGEITFSVADTCVLQVTGSKKYKLALRAIGGPGSASAVIGVVFNWFDSIQAPLGTTTLSNLGSDNDTDWTLLEATVMAPVGAAFVTLDFTIGDMFTLPNAAHYIDDVNFNQTEFAPIVDPFRTIKNVSLLEGPIINSERKMGSTCGGRCGGSTAVEIEFSLVGSQPWLYSAPIPVVDCVTVGEAAGPIIGSTLSGTTTNSPLLAGGTTINSAQFAELPVIPSGQPVFIVLDPSGTNGPPEIVEVTVHAAAATSITVVRGQQGSTAREHSFGTVWVLQSDCDQDFCAEGLVQEVYSALGTPQCAPPSLPPTAIYAGCGIPDVNNWEAMYITAPRALWNSISEVVPVITIQTGGFPLVQARLGFYSSPDGNPCADLINNPSNCDVICDQLYILAIPNNSKFYIDGRTRKMSLVCGSNSVFPGEPYTLGPFSWPAFDCFGFCMEFAFNPAFKTEELCVSLSLVPRTTM